MNRAKIIFELDEAHGRKPLTQKQIAEKVGVPRQTINDTERAFIAAAGDDSLFFKSVHRVLKNTT